MNTAVPAAPRIRILRGADCDPALLALNNDHQFELSLLDLPRLRALADMAFLAARVDGADALLIAFDQDAAYDSPNFLWFRARHHRFIYVDRVVVAPRRRGAGLARALYGRLAETAAAAGHDRLCCEINTEPPNPNSEGFHQAAGFVPVGGAATPSGKRVRYWTRPLFAGAPAPFRNGSASRAPGTAAPDYRSHACPGPPDEYARREDASGRG